VKTREFFVGQQYLGSGPAPQEFVHDEVHDPIGQAFFCPICSEVWAQALVEGQPTQVRHRPCAKHRPGDRYSFNSLGHISQYDIPGSLWLAESRTWNDSLPERVVARELQITLAWAIAASVLPPHIASIAKDVHNGIISTQRNPR
jgi:hypothetical protein